MERIPLRGPEPTRRKEGYDYSTTRGDSSWLVSTQQDCVAEEGWEGVSDAGESGASREDAQGDGRVGFIGLCECELVKAFSLPRKWPTLTTIRPSRRGTRSWWYGQIRATQPVDARYQLFLSDEGKVSCGFRYLKNHPAEAVERKPKPTRRITVIRTPIANVIMLPPWS